MSHVALVFIVCVAMCGCVRVSQSKDAKDIGLCNADESAVMHIQASVSVNEIILGIQEVRKVDGGAILGVRQWPDENSESNSDADIFKLKMDKNRYLIIETGEVRGFLDGGGKIHCLRWENDKWQIYKTVGWVS